MSPLSSVRKGFNCLCHHSVDKLNKLQINVSVSWNKFRMTRVNSLAPGKFEWNFRHLIFQIISVIDGWGISCELALRRMSLDLTDDKSTLVQVMAWCRQATSHYLSQCWPRSLSPYGVTKPQWVKPSFRRIPNGFCGDKSALVQVTVWCTNNVHDNNEHSFIPIFILMLKYCAIWLCIHTCLLLRDFSFLVIV